ncbi:MAG: glycosyltransferase family 2 protein [Actinomycetota bacterium]|nr:glycosyltransferase family 2 protein [Actinomycetota bacterium]
MERLRASVVIATWNAADVLGACLDSLAAQRVEGGFETIVVDNASTDRTPEVVAAHAERIRTIRNEENLHYGGANNQGAREARGDVLVFLNPDTELRGPDALATLVAAADAPGAGLAGPLLLNPDDTLQPSCASFPSVPRALLTATGTFRLLPERLRRRMSADHWAHDAPADVDWVMGAALAVRAELFRELGGFWPQMYAEEEDLAYRVRARGLCVRFEPAARVMHVGNHSAAQRWSPAERGRMVAEADLLFLRTHYSRPRATAIRAVTGAGYAARVVVHGLLGRRDAVALFATMARAYAQGTRSPSASSRIRASSA